jgi:hypothetical protein
VRLIAIALPPTVTGLPPVVLVALSVPLDTSSVRTRLSFASASLRSAPINASGDNTPDTIDSETGTLEIDGAVALPELVSTTLTGAVAVTVARFVTWV